MELTLVLMIPELKSWVKWNKSYSKVNRGADKVFGGRKT